MTKQIIRMVILIFFFFLLHTGFGFCEQINQSILKSVRTREHKNFTRIVFEFQNAVQFKDPKIKDKGTFSVLFLDSSTDLSLSTVYKTDSLQKVQSVEFIKNKSNLTATVRLTFPYFMLKAFSLYALDHIVVDAYKLTPLTKEAAKQSTEALKEQRTPQKGMKTSDEKDETMGYVIPDDPEKKTTDTIVEEVTQQTKQDIHRVDQKVEELDRKISDLDEKTLKSEWAQRIKFSGDLRIRYQKDFKDEANELRLGSKGLEDTNIDRTRWCYRARLGFKTNLVDPREVNVGKVEAGLRISTGNEENPVSTNETLGDYSNKDSIVLDCAYLKWNYIPTLPVWGNKLPQITLTAGRMANPFYYYDLVWDRDLGFEGLTLSFVSDTTESNSWRLFLTAGAYPLQELEFRTKDKWLYGGQISIEHRPFNGFNYKLAVAYYDFSNVQGKPVKRFEELSKVDWTWSAPGFLQGGNTLFDANELLGPITDTDPLPALASDYDEIDISAMIDIDRFSPIHIILQGEYVKNLAYDKNEVLRLNPNVPSEALNQTEGYQIGMMVGYPKTLAFGDWNVALSYKRLEADAVLDAFTDTDFHMGGTDSEGWILSGQLGLYKNVWLKSRWLSANEIIEGNGQFAVDTLQVSLNASF